MPSIVISRLPRPEQSGDWHDKPLKWQAAGPGAELQKFATRKGAELYRKCRRMAGTQAGAFHLFLDSPNPAF